MSRIKLFTLFLFSFIINQALAQTVVTGKVIDATTKQGLANFNVYINNTSVGTSTDSEGKFKLISPNSEKIELVVSHLLYKKRTILIESTKSNQVVVEMIPQEHNLNEVIIKSTKKANPAKIKEWLEIFSINLIGEYKGVASQCKIKNPEALYFDYNPENKDLKFFAREPLLIENLALGYLIKLELDDCVYNLLTEQVVFRYSAFFENLAMPRPKMVLALNKRKALYEGSKMHFLRALYENTIEQQSFTIYKYSSIKNAERERVSQKMQKRISEVYPNEVYPKIDVTRLFSVPDTLRYFGEVMAKDEILRIDTVRLSASTLIKTDESLSIVNFNSSDTLMIQFRGEDKTKTLPAAKIKTGRVVKPNSTIKPIFQWHSFIYFINKEGINIQKNGFYPELGILVYGDMGERRIAGMLPFDFDPNKTEL